jgi:hypothetical protein
LEGPENLGKSKRRPTGRQGRKKASDSKRESVPWEYEPALRNGGDRWLAEEL